VPYEPPTLEYLVSKAIQYYTGTTTRITDFNVGSKIRTLFEATGIMLQEIAKDFYDELAAAIATAVYNSFQFDRLGPTKAYGEVTFRLRTAATADVLIAAGSQVKVPQTSKIYAVVQDAIIPAGQTQVAALVQALAPGSVYNTPAGTITELVTPIDGIASISNIKPLITGRDPETDEERRGRFTRYIKSLARGTEAALEYAATTTALYDNNGFITERVVKAQVVKVATSYVHLYIHNGQGSTSDDLVAEVVKAVNGYLDNQGNKVPGYKAAGDTVDVFKAIEQSLSVRVGILPETGYTLADLTDAVISAIQDYFAGLAIGAPVLRSGLLEAIMRVTGVLDADIILPAQNVGGVAGTVYVIAGDPIIEALAA
jgi:uncharacterized phage protein gp47/JayE